MDNSVNIVPSVAGDVFELQDNLRAEDIQECQAAGLTPLKALSDAYVLSELCYSAKVNGKTEAMFGVSSFKQPKGYGAVWYLGSDESFRHPIALVKGGRQYIEEWLKKFKVLYNRVDARNLKHIEWLKCVGFKFTGKTDINGYEFLNFYINKE